MKRALLLLPVFAAQIAFAQTATLANGTLHVHDGTTLRFMGPLTFAPSAGSAVVNDGVIDLGSVATLVEPDGNPITGGGVETAHTAIDGPFADVEPGGLGLTITTTALGTITVTRGHLARSFPEGDPRIARWYRPEITGGPAAPLEVVLAYDATELNGLSASAIGLFGADLADGLWSPIVGTTDPIEHTVSGSVAAPWPYLTAFDQDAPTASSTLVAMQGLQVWPTLTNGPLYVQATDGKDLGTLELFDGLGRRLNDYRVIRSATLATLDLSLLSSGPYFLRAGQGITIKLRKE